MWWGSRRKQKPAVQCLCWTGELCVQAEQTVQPPVQSVRLLYCYQLLGLRHLHSPFTPCSCFQSRLRMWFYKWFSKIITLASTCHSNYFAYNFLQRVQMLGGKRMWWRISRPRFSCLPYFFYSQHLQWQPALADTNCKAKVTPPWPALTN